MSARNHRQCPACLKRREAEIEKQRSDVSRCYGKELMSTFMERISYLNSFADTVLPDSLAEYYEMGFNGSQFKLRYNCACLLCSFSYATELSDNHVKVQD